jgi:hypothetical protein
MILKLQSLQCLVPEKKLQKFDAAVSELLSSTHVTPRQLCSVAGMVVSFALAVPLGRLYTHQLYLAITGVLSWDQALPVGDELKQHLMWLKHYVPAHNGNHWFRRIPGVVLVSDVSVKGVGGIAATSGSNNESVVHVALQSQIPVELQVASSTCREAVGVLSLFSTLLQQPTWAALLKHRAVKILTDNQGVAGYIYSGCRFWLLYGNLAV